MWVNLRRKNHLPINNNPYMKIFTPLMISFFLVTGSWAQNFGIQLDGNTGSVSLCDSENFDIGDGFTLEAWIFAAEWKAEAWQGSILNKDQQGPDSGFGFRAGKNGTLSMVMSVDQAWFEVQTDPIMNANQWYHVAAVVDGGTLSLFINGELINSGSFSGSPTANGQLLTIGTSPGFPGRTWNGVLDEIRVWNVARSADEIADNQTTAFTGNEAGLVAYLPMNEGSGTTAANLADSDCDGELVNLSDSDWQEGYSVPAIDAGVVAVLGPDVLSLYERPVKVQILIQNFGAEPITDIPVELDVNGLPTLSDNYTGTIQPGATATFTFSQPLNLTDNNTNLLNAKTAHPNDDNSLNNAVSYRYKRPDDETLLNILNEEQHNFGSAGQTQFTVVNMPENMEDFDQLLLHISVECPNTGCDPWDQPAQLMVIQDNVEYEIARFITPFGIECGDWVVDVTDFKSILAGPITFKSFVQVWGPSGWLVNVDLEFIKGDAPSYQQLTELWREDNWVYGDPDVNYDLDAQTNTIAENTQEAHMRMTITGHGQGNTENAAEFANKTHTIMVNNATAGSHNLWKADCAENACDDQAGTWLFSRAGWCPGQEVIPFLFDLNDEATPGEDLTLDYELEEYTNLLNTGYNGGSHTEPHFRISGYLVEQSDMHFTSFTNLKAQSILIETNGNPDNPVFEAVKLTIRNTGTTAVSNPSVAYYVNDDFILEETIDGTIDAGAVLQHEFSTVDGFTAGQDNYVIAVVTAASDENVSDDAIGTNLDDELTHVEEVFEGRVRVFPNPSAGLVQIEMSEALLNGNLELFDLNGRLLQQQPIQDLNERMNIATQGIYFLRLTNNLGQTRFEKVVVTQ